MKDFSSQFSELKNSLEAAAFLVSKGNSEKEAHAKIVQCLVFLSQLESEVNDLLKIECISQANTPEGRIPNPSHIEQKDSTIPKGNSSNEIAIEIKKVKRRVPRWFKNPIQYNSTILNCFLELYDLNHQITVHMLRNKCHVLNDFDGNYNQMKNFGEKNHGKVFEESNGIINLWEPVKEFILELYKKQKV